MITASTAQHFLNMHHANELRPDVLVDHGLWNRTHWLEIFMTALRAAARFDRHAMRDAHCVATGSEAVRYRGMNHHDANNAKLPEPDFELDEAAHSVVDAALEVHRVLGPGLVEAVYEEALSMELGFRGVPFTRQIPVAVKYKNVVIGEARLDLLVTSRLVVELKACQQLLPIHVAQVLSYLKASECSLGLLINFNVRRLHQGIRRVIRTI